MAYDTKKLSMILSTIEGQGMSLWSYVTADSIATVMGAAYMSDALLKGVKIGDLVLVASGTLLTTTYPASGASTTDVGEQTDFTAVPQYLWAQVVSFTANAANLAGANQTIGGAATDKVGFYGATPVVQPTAAAQAAITDGSTGTAAPTNGVAALTATYNSTLIINALATIIAQTNAMRTALVNLGLMKGS